jgi:hypothetical protein
MQTDVRSERFNRRSPGILMRLENSEMMWTQLIRMQTFCLYFVGFWHTLSEDVPRSIQKKIKLRRVRIFVGLLYFSGFKRGLRNTFFRHFNGSRLWLNLMLCTKFVLNLYSIF